MLVMVGLLLVTGTVGELIVALQRRYGSVLDGALRWSSRRREAGEPYAPGLGPVGWLRWVWRQLTRCVRRCSCCSCWRWPRCRDRCCPQRGVNPARVARLLRATTRRSRRCSTGSACSTSTPRRGSPRSTCCCSSRWSAASCRARGVHLREHRARRPPARRAGLERLPEHAQPRRRRRRPATSLAAARQALRRGRFRRDEHEGGSVAAEKGYLQGDRQPGLPRRAAAPAGRRRPAICRLQGQLAGHRGRGLLQHGPQYDSVKSGASAGPGDAGARSRCTSTASTSATSRTATSAAPRALRREGHLRRPGSRRSDRRRSRVNHPLRRRRRQGLPHRPRLQPDVHGHATATARSCADAGRRSCRATATTPRAGAVKVPDGATAPQLGVPGLLPADRADATKQSARSRSSRGLLIPRWSLIAYRATWASTPVAQSVYSLDTTHLTQVSDNGAQWTRSIGIGETATLPDGTSITFDGVRRFANFQVSHDPGKPAGTGRRHARAGRADCMSLLLRQRRVWVRATPGTDGRTVVAGRRAGQAVTPRGCAPRSTASPRRSPPPRRSSPAPIRPSSTARRTPRGEPVTLAALSLDLAVLGHGRLRDGDGVLLRRARGRGRPSCRSAAPVPAQVAGSTSTPAEAGRGRVPSIAPAARAGGGRTAVSFTVLAFVLHAAGVLTRGLAAAAGAVGQHVRVRDHRDPRRLAVCCLIVPAHPAGPRCRRRSS